MYKHVLYEQSLLQNSTHICMKDYKICFISKKYCEGTMKDLQKKCTG